ncbi:MAG: hypothetical protein ACOCUW_02165, partial [Gemmatimonadota bacterium]
ATSCTIPLSEVTVNTANLLLTTVPGGGRRPERPMRLESRAVLQAPGVPLTRAPLSRPLGQLEDEVGVAAFADPTTTEVIRLPVTDYVRGNIEPADGEDPAEWLALVALDERLHFGYGQFAGIASDAPPQLELVVTIPVRKVDP